MRLPAVPGDVQSVIGMRRPGKTTLLRQLLNKHRAEAEPERALAGASLSAEPCGEQRRLLVLDHEAVLRTVAHGVPVQPAYEWLLASSAEG